MDPTLLHPKLVHLPIALAVLLPLITGGLLVAWWRGWLPRRTWWIAIGLQVLLVGSGVVASQTGEIDEEVAERVVPEAAMEAHEEAAEVFVAVSGGVLALLLVVPWVRRERAALGLAGLGFLATLGGLGLGYRVGEAGGRLVYEHDVARAWIAARGTAVDGPPAAAGLRADFEGEDEDDDTDEGRH